ncbi:TonB-dependent receptor [Roseivirga sp. BDSF3-8]|uniref:TonB-dependent receptor n=1 Tax=Roseivirga sp. BDSF3-8 TaxID=3241598 RepID=UPI0035324A27
MKRTTYSRLLAIWAVFMLITYQGFGQGQTIVSGQVSDAETGEPLIGVNIIVKGKVLGTVTDIQGNYRLKVNSAPPLTLVYSIVGFEPQELVITDAVSEGINVQMSEQVLLGQEVVVSASRVEENILQSPVSIEKMDILEIRNTASDDYYKSIGNLKGVDVTTSSINFTIINSRGFNGTGNTRFVQLIDGMDSQAPALNFPVGNLNGPTELDVETLEYIPGASSALYGPNAFNGILLVNSKNPFQYQGLSAMAKFGLNHFNGNSLEPENPQPMYTAAIRYAKAFNNKFAFKVNLSYSQAEDWYGTDLSDRFPERGPSDFGAAVPPGGEGLYADLPDNVLSTYYQNPGANLVHGYGDDAAIAMPLVGFNAEDQLRAAGYGPYIDEGDIPNVVVARTPYLEESVVDYGAENFKANAALHYRFSDRLEGIANWNYGFGTTVYTGAQRYSLSNFNISQYKLELRSDNFFVRGYTTQERSGDSYIADFLALQVNNSWQSNPDWFGTYLGGYLGYLEQSGIAPGTSTAQQRQAAHWAARQIADQGRLLPGTAGFEEAADQIRDEVIPQGAKFDDATNLWHGEAQYDFKNITDALELQVGASYRLYELNSNGTIFADSAGNDITIQEYGGYMQAGKRMFDDKFKLTGSVRYDKNENFDGQVNPRISGVYTLGEGTHNIRASYQTGFRIPTTQGQHINLSTGAFRLIGGLPQYYEAYDIFNNAYTARSVNTYIAAVADSGTTAALVDPANIALLERAEFDPVKPEQVRAYEIGYKGLFNNNLLIDFAYYYNRYDDFIAQVQVRKASGDVAVNAINAQSLLSGSDQNTFQTYTNVDQSISAQGAVFGLTYSLMDGYSFDVNYNWNRLNDADALVEQGFLAEFNTPEHKFNIGFGNRKVTDRFGFKVTYRWQEEFLYESSFAQGIVPAVGTFDAQLSYKLPDMKSIVKIGGSNLLNERYVLNYGGPNIGAIYYVSITFDELMN